MASRKHKGLLKTQVWLTSRNYGLWRFSRVFLESAGDKGANRRREHLPVYGPDVKNQNVLP